MRVRLLQLRGTRTASGSAWQYHLIGFAQLGHTGGMYGAESPVRVSAKVARTLLGIMHHQPDDVLTFTIPVTLVSP